MNIMLNETAYMPTRAHAVDAGIDLYAPNPVEGGRTWMN